MGAKCRANSREPSAPAPIPRELQGAKGRNDARRFQDGPSLALLFVQDPVRLGEIPRVWAGIGYRTNNPSLRGRSAPEAISHSRERFLPAGASATGPAGPRGSGFVASLLPTNMKRASAPVDMVVAPESQYQKALSGAVGTVHGSDVRLGFGGRAAGGWQRDLDRDRECDDPDPAPRHPSPAACSPSPVIRDRAAGGQRRGAGPGSGAGAGRCPGRLDGGACWLMRTE